MGVKQSDRDEDSDIAINGATARRIAAEDLPQDVQDELAEDIRRVEAGLPPTGRRLSDPPSSNAANQ